jgi:hypothetical protein
VLCERHKEKVSLDELYSYFTPE